MKKKPAKKPALPAPPPQSSPMQPPSGGPPALGSAGMPGSSFNLFPKGKGK